jgi:6-phosphogluconolactonase
MGDLRIYPDKASASRAMASLVAQVSQSAVAVRDRFTLALSGGKTPHDVYRLLADEFSDDIDWMRTYIFWSDERCVPHTDPESNLRMARETLLNHVPIAFDHIYPVPTEFPPLQAADLYQSQIDRFFEMRGGRPRFDLLLLGMGADGHTASLFPGSPALEERVARVIAVTVDAPIRDRVTFTLPVLNSAAHVAFLVTGEDKAEALTHIMTQTEGTPLPAARVQPTDGRLTWIVDEAAAEGLRTRGRDIPE